MPDRVPELAGRKLNGGLRAQFGSSCPPFIIETDGRFQSVSNVSGIDLSKPPLALRRGLPQLRGSETSATDVGQSLLNARHTASTTTHELT